MSRHELPTSNETRPKGAKKIIARTAAALALAMPAIIACEPTPIDPNETTTTTATPDNDVVAVGDSMIWMSDWSLKQRLPGTEVHSASGKRIDEVQPLVDAAVTSDNKYLLYNAGTNDAMQKLNPTSNFNVLINTLESSDLDCVVLATVNEGTADFQTIYRGTPEQYDPTSAATLNALIRETVATKNLDAEGPYYTIADWNGAVMAPGGEVFLSDDRIHQSQVGIEQTVTLFEEGLAACPDYNITVNG